VYAAPYLILFRIHRAAIDARRKSRTWHYLAWSALAGLVEGAMLAFGISIFVAFWILGLWWIALPLGALMVVPLLFPPLVRHVLVPLGWTRIAYWVARLSRPGPDAPAYGACCAAWAFSFDPSPSSEVWLAQRREARIPLGDAEVVVTALIAAGKGDAETCRQLLRSIAMLVEDHAPVREIAGEWLATDAAERGAWRELFDTADSNRWPATPLTFLLEGIAARYVGAPGAPGKGELAARWLLAPHRRATRALIDTPYSEQPATVTETETDSSAGPSSELVEAPLPLPRAVATHLAFGNHDPTAARLAMTVRAWDSALADGMTHSWLARRALELDAPLGAVDRALREVAGAVTEELARAADRARLGAPPSHGPVGDALARKLRHGRLDALETGFARWAQRRHDGAARAAIDEWREFIALQTAYTDAVTAGGLELRRLAFPHAFSTGSNMAAWLWNTRHEYALSHAISKWLLSEALAVGDTEAIELGHRNCRLDVITRLGPVLGDTGN
jgi:hypothetical protein